MGGECSEIAQIAKDDDDFGTLTGKHALVASLVDELGDLWREKSLQSCYPFRALLGNREFSAPSD